MTTDLRVTIISKNNEQSIENLLKNIYGEVEEIIFVEVQLIKPLILLKNT